MDKLRAIQCTLNATPSFLIGSASLEGCTPNDLDYIVQEEDLEAVIASLPLEVRATQTIVNDPTYLHVDRHSALYQYHFITDESAIKLDLFVFDDPCKYQAVLNAAVTSKSIHNNCMSLEDKTLRVAVFTKLFEMFYYTRNKIQ